MKKIIALLVVIYGVVCAGVYYYPLPFFYNPSDKPSSLENAHANGYKAQKVEYKSEDGTELLAWYTKPAAKNKKIIVFMHGNSYNIETFYYKLKPFVEAGYATFLPEYRGFGGLKGKVSEANLSMDAIAAIQQLYKLGYKNSDIFVYGMSLGTYMATNAVVELNKNGKFAGLILEVPFDSLLNTAKMQTPVYLPFDWVMKDKYDTAAIIKKINTRLLIMGGTQDPTIPLELAKSLFEQANQPKKMIVYQGGAHSNLFNFRNDRDILKWLKN